MKKSLLLLQLLLITATTLHAQIPNGGFESWTNMGTYYNPDGWSTLNDMTAPGGVFTCTQGTPGNPGNYYLKLTSKSLWGLGILPGFAVCGTIDTASMLPLGGFPFSSRPANFTGKWQHMIFGTSQGYLEVTLSYWDPVNQTREPVASAYHELTGMAMNWANFTIPFTYVSSQSPDSCIIVLSSSGSTAALNDYLWVDDLGFSGTVSGIQEANGAPAIYLSPNPAAEEVMVDLTKVKSPFVSLRLLTLSGNMIKNIPDLRAGEKHTLNISDLPAGVYLMKLETTEGAQTRTFIKK